MKLGLLAHDLTQPRIRGLARYTAGLVRALAATGAVEVVLFARRPLAETYADLPGRRCVWGGAREVLWEQWGLPRKAAACHVDVIHAPSNRGLCAFASCPTVLTRHDAIERLFPPDFPGPVRGRLRMYYSDEISVRRATAVATISETSKQDILRVWGINGGRVVVAGEGIGGRFFRGASKAEMGEVRAKYGLTHPYILYVGGFDRRKDLVTLVEAYAAWGRKDVLCVLAGPTRGELQQVRKVVARHGLGERVRIPGEIDDQDIVGLYGGAACFVYPSRYEGLGLQAAEAMAVGVPVIASDGGALPEVVGDAGLIFEAGSAGALAARLRELFSDAQLRARLVERGFRRAQDFRWGRIAPRYVALYRTLLNGGMPQPDTYGVNR